MGSRHHPYSLKFLQDFSSFVNLRVFTEFSVIDDLIIVNIVIFHSIKT